MFIVKGLSYITAKLVVIYDTNKEKAHYPKSVIRKSFLSFSNDRH